MRTTGLCKGLYMSISPKVSFDANTTFYEKASRFSHVALSVLSGWFLCSLEATIRTPRMVEENTAIHIPSVLHLVGGDSLRILNPYIGITALCLTARKILSTLIGYIVYPAAIPFRFDKDAIAKKREEQIQTLVERDFKVRNFSIKKSGNTYDALLITHPRTMENGNWTLHALGNGVIMEDVIEQFATENRSNDCNTLLINGPSVIASRGWPTRYQMGAAFEGGLQFLEQKVKARRIIMQGFSLGGGMLAEAILQHEFTEGQKRHVQYLSISDRTFSSLSTIVGEMISFIVKPIFSVLGVELDGIQAAKKLSDLKIKHIIINHKSTSERGSDSLIPDRVSLAHELQSNHSDLQDKIFLESPKITHNGPLPREIQKRLKEEIEQFTKSPHWILTNDCPNPSFCLCGSTEECS